MLAVTDKLALTSTIVCWSKQLQGLPASTGYSDKPHFLVGEGQGDIVEEHVDGRYYYNHL